MDKPLILYIETATNTCSVALSEGKNLLGVKESHEEKSHAAQLSPFVKDLLQASNRSFNELSAVCVSIGPGSYTGLRIGISTAKGIAFGLGIPVLAVDTLESLTITARQVLKRPQEEEGAPLLFCPMLDARRMEVYSAVYNPKMERVRDVAAEIIDRDSYHELLEQNRMLFFGNGAPKCKEVILHPNALFADDLQPSAAGMIEPALERFKNGQFEDTAYFEPRYLKEFIATTPKNKLF